MSAQLKARIIDEMEDVYDRIVPNTPQGIIQTIRIALESAPYADSDLDEPLLLELLARATQTPGTAVTTDINGEFPYALEFKVELYHDSDIPGAPVVGKLFIDQIEEDVTYGRTASVCESEITIEYQPWEPGQRHRAELMELSKEELVRRILILEAERT